jgi:hypothetical protein
MMVSATQRLFTELAGKQKVPLALIEKHVDETKKVLIKK